VLAVSERASHLALAAGRVRPTPPAASSRETAATSWRQVT
jgi:hypothetical protein